MSPISGTFGILRLNTLYIALFILLQATYATSIAFAQAPPRPIDLTPLDSWQKPEWGGKPLTWITGDGGFGMELVPERSWSAITQTVDIDVDATPVLAVYLASASKGVKWLLRLNNQPYDPNHPEQIEPKPAGGDTPGVYLVDLRELGGWKGRQKIEIRMYVTGDNPGTIVFPKVVLLRVSSSGGSVLGASTADAKSISLVTGPWLFTYSPKSGQFSICKPGAIGAAVGRLPAGVRVESSDLREGPNTTMAVVRSGNEWGRFETHITAHKKPAGVFRWTVDVELTVQLDPLISALKYERGLNVTTGIPERIIPTLMQFYTPSTRTIRDWKLETNPQNSMRAG